MWKGKYPGKVCLPIVETTMNQALQSVREANRLADLVEVRLDFMQKPSLNLLLAAGKKSIIVTNRRKEEGGRYAGEERTRLALLQDAVDLDASYVDVEMKTDRLFLRLLLSHRKKSQIILSHHDFQKTTSPGELRRLFERMARQGADVVKIVTLARAWEDNFKVLSLIPYARERKQEIIALCMGEKGKMSRIFAPLMGAAWTYASLTRNRASAPGQLTVRELRQIWEKLG